MGLSLGCKVKVLLQIQNGWPAVCPARTHASIPQERMECASIPQERLE